MEALAAVVASIVICALSYCMCTFLNEHWKYMKSPTKEIETLRNIRRDLNDRMTDITVRLRKEEQEHRKKPTSEVQTWLKNVRYSIFDINDIEEEARVGKISLNGVLPNCRSRLNLGRRISGRIMEATKLLDKSFSDDSLAIHKPDRGIPMPTPVIVGKTTAEKNLEMVWGCLMNDEVRKIGVFGMGGIGKTTLLMKINNRLLEEKVYFDKVIWVTVSKNSNIHKVQDDIAQAIGLDFSTEKCLLKRSALLLRELERRKRVMLILDDMWDAFFLYEIGIPEPTKANRCKLALSTRSIEVCHRMGCQRRVEVELLSKEESWELFVAKIGNVLTPEVTEIAKLIVDECDRLPLAIITTGGAMRGKDDIREWRFALKDMRDSTCWVMDMGKVSKCLKFSFDQLGNEIIKKCFLCCALYPEDFKIPEGDLIDYWINEALIKERSRQDEVDRAQFILNKLRNSCMLESSTLGPRSYVKMHDLLRDMALKITDTSQNVLVRAGTKLEEIPDVAEWAENLEKASLMWNEIKAIYSSPKCPGFSTLLLQQNPLQSITRDFFMHLLGLRVLDLSETKLEVLPDSISELVNLRVLLLSRCKQLKRIPSVAKLQLLEVLRLDLSALTELPEGMEALVNLKILDLWQADLREVPIVLILKFSLLQELCLDHLRERESGITSVEDLLSLRQMENLTVHFPCLSNFIINSQITKGLNKFNFMVADPNEWRDMELKMFSLENSYLYWKRLVSVSNKIHRIPDNSLVLPQNTQYLRIQQFNDLTRFSELSCLKEAMDLRECRIIACRKMKYIMSSEDVTEEQGHLLQHVEMLEIEKCPNVRFLFSSKLFKQFQKLEQVRVIDCGEFEEIIIASEDEEIEGEGKQEKSEGSYGSNSNINSSIIITLPSLQFIHLEKVRVKRLWSGITVCNSLRKLEVYACHELKTLFSTKSLQHCPNLEVITVCRCRKMEELLTAGEDSGEWSTSNTTSTIRVPRLQILWLKELPKLESIWKGVMACDYLQKVVVVKCVQLKRLPQFSALPLTLKEIRASKEWWDALEWDHPSEKNILQPFFKEVCMPTNTYSKLRNIALKVRDVQQAELLASSSHSARSIT